MNGMNRRLVLKSTVAAMAATSLPRLSEAQSLGSTAPSYSPDDLKGTLTPFGAIRAGNADGIIPAWTG